MADSTTKMDWFKFKIIKWLDGRISLADIAAQGLFLNLAMRSIENNGELKPGEFFAEKLHSTPEMLESAFKQLFRLKLIRDLGDGKIMVPFVLDLIAEAESFNWKIKEARSAAGKKGMAKRWGKQIDESITNDNKNNKTYQTITNDNKNNNITLHNNIDISNSKELSISSRASARETNSPSVLIGFPENPEEVILQAKAQGMKWEVEEAENFISWNASRGWMTSGGVIMYDWRKALRGWHNRERQTTKQNRKNEGDYNL